MFVQYVLLDSSGPAVSLPPAGVCVFRGILRYCGKNAEMYRLKFGSPVLIRLCGSQMRCWQFVCPPPPPLFPLTSSLHFVHLLCSSSFSSSSSSSSSPPQTKEKRSARPVCRSSGSREMSERRRVARGSDQERW